MKTNYTFWQLLKQHRIEIPKIQRDYAQGRKNPAIVKIVDKFLDAIKKAIINDEALNLDFVYGRVENNTLTPLDGQQRLTTLFLIHWYIALKEDRLTDKVKKTLSNFTYEIRMSSEDFCKNLVEENLDYNNLINDNIRDSIIDSKWYFLSWEKDPTVSAMLNMLETIHNKFKNVDALLFDRLKQEIVTFQFLSLDEFKLADELYIKMNARGKPLTEFENFKANFYHFLKSEKSKLDNEWLDIFWNIEKSNNTNINTDKVDEIFLNFFKNITLNFYVETQSIDKETLDNYNLFDIYEKVFKNEEYISQTIKILDGLITYDDHKSIFKNFLSVPINYAQRLHFYSLGKFLINYGEVTKENSTILKKWLRVTFNLINNTRTERPKDFKDAINSLKKLSKNIANIYKYVSANHHAIEYFSRLQKEEESLKARLILKDSNWENLFVEIEQHSYFDGQIGFILKYAEGEDGNYNQALFSNYSKKLSKLFGKNFKEQHSFLFQRALLATGDYLPAIGNNYTFCSFEEALRTKTDNWRKVFNDDERTLILKKLLDNINEDTLQNDLQIIIDKHNVSDWRKLIIETPKDIAYCQNRRVRYYSKDEIYLLSKKQINGRHKEIFSLNLFRLQFKNKTFFPFDTEIWYWESTSSEQPSIVFESFKYNENNLLIEVIYHKNGKFKLIFYDLNEMEIPQPIRESLEKLSFRSNKNKLHKMEIKISELEVENKINAVCAELRNHLLIINTEKSDLPFVYHLFDEAILYQKRKNYPVWKGYDKTVLNKDIEDKRAFKIVINNEIACIFSITLDDMAWNDDGLGIAVYVHRVVVNPTYKGQKLFGVITNWLINYAKENQLKLVRMDTWGNNPVIIDYYKTFGFELIGFQQYPNTEDIPIQMRGNRSALLEYKIF